RGGEPATPVRLHGLGGLGEVERLVVLAEQHGARQLAGQHDAGRVAELTGAVSAPCSASSTEPIARLDIATIGSSPCCARKSQTARFSSATASRWVPVANRCIW